MKLKTRRNTTILALLSISTFYSFYLVLSKSTPMRILKREDYTQSRIFKVSEDSSRSERIEFREQGSEEEKIDELFQLNTSNILSISRKNGNSSFFNVFDIVDRTLITGGQKIKIAANNDKNSAEGTINLILIPHSHTDPGWKRTVQEYYDEKVKDILDNLVVKLQAHESMTFIWSETIFLQKWWSEQPEDKKRTVRNLVNSKRLELVSGGWTVPDEAITHYFSLIGSQAEGHQWLFKTFGVHPRNMWAIDPFGMSTALAYIRQQSGLDFIVTDRVDRIVKEYLKNRQLLEFSWRQFWDQPGDNDIFTHVMPYFSYGVTTTCGPDFTICKSVNFFSSTATLNTSSVKTISENLVRNLRAKSQHFVHNTLFTAIGGDFAFTKSADWNSVYSNFKLIIDYVNNNTEFNTNIRFGTVADYLSSVSEEIKENRKSLPVMRGDFFPYNDYMMDYWTGYFSTRPYGKRLGRQVEETLLSAEIMASVAIPSFLAEKRSEKAANIELDLQSARRNLSLFQHHDAITGTCHTHVMRDYEARLLDARGIAEALIGSLAKRLFNINSSTNSAVDAEELETHKSINQTLNFVVINPSPRTRRSTVSLASGGHDIVITDPQGAYVKCQTDFIHPADNPKYQSEQRIYFETDLPAFSGRVYTVKKDMLNSGKNCLSSKYTDVPTAKSFVREDLNLTVRYSNPQAFELCARDFGGCYDISWHVYQPGSRTGPYLFAGYGTERFFKDTPQIRIIDGILQTEIRMKWRFIQLIFTLYHSSGIDSTGIHTQMVFDISGGEITEAEVVLRVATGVNNGDIFYTDSNGMQLIKRKYREKLAPAANFFPMTTMVCIEDPFHRVTLHSSQPHAVSSLVNGILDILVERRVFTRDYKDAHEHIHDNTETTINFIIQHETRKTKIELDSNYTTFPSMTSVLVNDFLQKPIYVRDVRIPSGEFILSRELLPCSVDIANVRPMFQSLSAEFGYGITLYNRQTDANFISDKDYNNVCDVSRRSVAIGRIFTYMKPISVHRTTLTYTEILGEIGSNTNVHLRPMELCSFFVRIK